MTVQEKEIKKIERQVPGTGTLCWDCTNTNKFACSWFDPDNPQPVPGWVAKKDTVRSQMGAGDNNHRLKIVDTYEVIRCPRFAPMPSTGGRAEPRQRAVKCLTTGKVYKSVRSAAAACNGYTYAITIACEHENHSAYGRKWAYVEEET